MPSTMTRNGTELDRRFYSVAEGAEVLRITRSTFAGMIARNEIRSVKMNGRRLIPVEAMDEFCASLDADPPPSDESTDHLYRSTAGARRGEQTRAGAA